MRLRTRPLCLLDLPHVVLPRSPPKLPEPFRSIADLAAAAPPEFTADALLRIVESGKLADQERSPRIDGAGVPVGGIRQISGANGGRARAPPRDTASGSLSQAYALKLDALSLQSRAVRDMLPLDPAKARELFGQIVKPTLAPLTCDDALVYEPSDFYQALSAVVNGAFTPKERAKEEHFNLLIDHLGQATSPSQLAPLAAAIESAGVTAGQRQILWARFNGLLENMQPDDRSFAASLPALSALSTPGIQASLEKYRQKNQAAPPTPRLHSGAQPQETQHAEAGSVLAIRERRSNCSQAGKKLRYRRALNYCRKPIAPRRMAAAAGRLSESDRRVGRRIKRNPTPSSITRSASSIRLCSIWCRPVPKATRSWPTMSISSAIPASISKARPNGSWNRTPCWTGLRTIPRSTPRCWLPIQDSGNPVLALEVALEKTFRRSPSSSAIAVGCSPYLASR